MNMLQENKILLDIPSHYKIVHSHISKSPPLIEVTVSQMLPTPSRLLKKLVVRSNFSMFAMAANGEMGGDPRCMCGIRYIVSSYSTLRTDSSRPFHRLPSAGRQQSAHSCFRSSDDPCDRAWPPCRRPCGTGAHQGPMLS